MCALPKRNPVRRWVDRLFRRSKTGCGSGPSPTSLIPHSSSVKEDDEVCPLHKRWLGRLFGRACTTPAAPAAQKGILGKAKDFASNHKLLVGGGAALLLLGGSEVMKQRSQNSAQVALLNATAPLSRPNATCP